MSQINVRIRCLECHRVINARITTFVRVEIGDVLDGETMPCRLCGATKGMEVLDQ